MNQVYLSVDLGGTNIKYGLVSSAGEIISSESFPARTQRGPEAVIKDIVDRLTEASASVNPRPSGVGVGAAGVVVPDEGLVVHSPNLPGWDNIPLGLLLEESLNMDVRLANDADLYALGEWLAGSGRGLSHMVGLTLGTGVGGGLVLENRLYSGPFGSAGEIGHMIVEPDGRPCGCGGRGCLEQYASATAMSRMAGELIGQGRLPEYSGREEDLTAEELSGLADAGDEDAAEVFARAGRALGLALVSLFNILGLQGAVIGGGASRAFDHLAPEMFRVFRERVFAVAPERASIVVGKLGDRAPLAGAPALFAGD